MMNEFEQKLDIFSPKTFLKSTSNKKVTDQMAINNRNHSTQNLKQTKYQNFPQQFVNYQSPDRLSNYTKNSKSPDSNNQLQQKLEQKGQIISNKENIVNLCNQNKDKQQSSILKKTENKKNIQQNKPLKAEENRSSSYFKNAFSNQNYQESKNSLLQRGENQQKNEPQNAMKESLLIDKFNSQFTNVNSPKISNIFVNKDKRPNSSKLDFQSNFARSNEQQNQIQRPSSNNTKKVSEDVQQGYYKVELQNHDKQSFQEKKSPNNQNQQKQKIHENVYYGKNELQNDKQFQDKKSPTYQSQIQESTKNSQAQKSMATRSQVIEFGSKMNNLKVQQFFTNEELYGKNSKQKQSENPVQDQKSSIIIQDQKSSQIIIKKTREQERNGEQAETVKDDPKDNKNFKQEYQEYQKLQEKLNYLETKINSIKTNINHNYQKEPVVNKDKPQFDINLKFSQQLKSQQNQQMKNSLISNTQNNQQFKKKNISEDQEVKKEHQELKKDRQELKKDKQDKSPLQDFITQVKPVFQDQDNAKKQGEKSEVPQTFLSSQQKFPQNSAKLRQSGFQSYQHVQEDEKDGKKSLVMPQKKSSSSVQSLRNSSIVCNQKQTRNNQFLYYVSSVISAFQNRGDNSYFAQLAREHLLQSMQAISFVKNLKKVSQKMIDDKKIILPKKENNKKTLVFDLDETLIHCQESTNVPCDVILPIKFPTGELIEAGINIRPYCLPCLQELSKYYEIIVFTASHSCYANVVLDYLDPNQKYITQRLFRENCIQTEEGVYIKDLRVLQNRSLSDIIIVDNASYSFGYQIENGLPILPYYDNKNDTELKNLIGYLKSIHHVKDVREVNKKMLKINQFGDFQDPVLLIQSLYSDLLT